MRSTPLDTTLRRLLRSWRQPPWALRPWSMMGRTYRLAVAGALLSEVVIATALLLAGAVPLETPSITIAAAAGALALFAGAQAFRETDATAEDVDLGIALTLVVAGRPIEAIVAVLVFRTVATVRKPLVAHLVCANIVHGCFSIVASAAIVDVLGHRAHSAVTFITLLAGFLGIQITIAGAVLWSLIAGGYVASRGAWSEALRANLPRQLSMFPIAIAVGWVINGAATSSAAVLLAIPPLVGLLSASRNDQLVDARDQATHDELTGLPNRRAFLDALSARSGDADAAHWLYVCDLDNFKQVNDRHGHAVGDHALRLAGTALDDASEDGATARLGGDEFAVFAIGGAREDAARLARSLGDGVHAAIGAFGVTASIGIHRIEPGDTETMALNKADIAMYVAKHSGPGRFAFSDAGDDATDGEDLGRLPSDIAPSDARAYWETVARACSDAGDPYGEVKAMYQMYWSSGDEAATSGADLLDAIQRRVGDAPGWAARARAAACGASGRIDAAQQADTEAIRLARLHGDVALEVAAQLGLAHAHRSQGEIDAAAGLLRSAVNLGERFRMHAFVVHGYGRLVECLIQNLETRSARDAAKACSDYVRVHHVPRGIALASALRAHAALAEGDLNTARQALSTLPADEIEIAERLRTSIEDVDRHGVPWGVDDEHGLRTRVAELRATALRTRAAPQLGDAPGEHPRASGASSPLAHIAMREITALDGSGDRASQLLEIARTWDASGRPLDCVRCMWHATMVVLHDGDTAVARRLLDEIAATCERLGATRDAQIVEETLRELVGDTLVERLPGAPVFDGLGDRELSLLRRASMRRRAVSGEEILAIGDLADALWVVESGTVRLYRRAATGKELTVELLDAGGLFGESAVFQQRSSVAAEVVDDAVLVGIPATRLTALLDSVPGLRENVMSHVGTRLSDTQRLAEQVAHWSVPQRLASLLLDLAARYGHPTLSGGTVINRPLTQMQLAEMVGATRQSVVKALADWRTAETISLRGRRIVIDDLSAITRLAMRGNGDEDPAEHSAA